MRCAVADAISFRSVQRVALALALAVPLFSAPAWAQSQDMRAVYERLERLQRDIDVLQRQLARGGAPSGAPSGAATGGGAGFTSDFIGRTEDRFASIEAQLRDLTGNVEELTHSTTLLKERLDKLVSDIDFRLSALERGAAAGAGAAAAAPAAQPPAAQPSAAQPAAPAAPAANVPSQSPVLAPGQQRLVLTPGPGGQAPAPAPAQTAAVAPPVQLPQGSPEAQYEFAYGTLLQAQREQGEFGRAEQALRAFIEANPNHRLAGNAQYWLGETFYVRRDYQGAAATFAEGVAKFPRSDKAPDNMLKLGMSLGQLKRTNEACGTLAELEKRYPNATAQVKQASQRERQRLSCK